MTGEFVEESSRAMQGINRQKLTNEPMTYLDLGGTFCFDSRRSCLPVSLEASFLQAECALSRAQLPVGVRDLLLRLFRHVKQRSRFSIVLFSGH